MPATRPEWADHLVPGARKSFANEYPRLPAEYVQLVNIETSSRAFEEDLVSTGLGTAAEKPEGEEVARDKPVPRGKVKYTHTGFGLGYEVTEELVEDELYGAVVPPSSRFLAAAMRDAEEVTAAAIFNNAFTTQQAYDGVSLINTTHPTVGAGDLANQPAVNIDLSVTALQGSVERFLLLKDDRGLRVRMVPSVVAVHPTNKWLASEILESEFKPFTANNEINAIAREGLQSFVYRYLTDTDAWYVLASKGMHQINFFWRRRPRFDDEFISKNAGLQLFFVTARFVAGATDWRGIDGSPGA